MRIGARYPNAGTLGGELGLASIARRLEAAGFDSLWTSDHLAMPVRSESRYPFSEDGRMAWPVDLGWSESLTALGIAAAATERIELGTGVLIAALRHPLLAAMQVAAISLEAGGRLSVGVGAGWLAEEFAAVGVPFSDRGRRLDAWIEVARAVWQGSLPARDCDFYPNPTDMVCRPMPVEPVPVLVGGTSRAAIERAAMNEGWVGLQPTSDIRIEQLAISVSDLRGCESELESSTPGRVIVQLTGSAGRHTEIASRLDELADAGVDEIIVDVDWSGEGPEPALDVLKAAA
jgi:probable F420-dependent oxidoreductase